MIQEPIALVSVSDKTNLVSLCKNLQKKYSIIATSGTASHLEKSGIPVTRISEITGSSEILDGRVKTLHPNIFGGILSRRTKEDRQTLTKFSIPEISVVICNLYPFTQDHELNAAIELIDIGGPSLIRAAAKNYHHVTILVDPLDYEKFGNQLTDNSITVEEREALALKAFQHVAWYNIEISTYFEKRSGRDFPNRFFLTGSNPQRLRYGENSHQKATYYITKSSQPFYRHLHGKEISFNNIADFGAGLRLIQEFDQPACAILKHRSPCGVAENEDLSLAFKQAFKTDSLSAYGGVAIINRPLDKKTAEAIMEVYVDGIIAPSYSSDAWDCLTKRKKIILLELTDVYHPQFDVVPTPNGLLVQQADFRLLTQNDVRVVSDKNPSDKDLRDLLWGWKVTRNCRSNSVVLSKNTQTVGIGSGAPSRVDAVQFALKKAGDEAKGSVMTSDAFFPFPDSIEEAAKAGIRAVLAPGGSIRDKLSIQAANDLGISLVFSTIRSFRH